MFPTGGMGGFDPSKMDPKWMMQVAQAMQRLPKGQIQKMQSILSRAMLGRDVSAEMAEFQRSLPADLQTLLNNPPIPADAMASATHAPGGTGVTKHLETLEGTATPVAGAQAADTSAPASLPQGQKSGWLGKIFGKKNA